MAQSPQELVEKIKRVTYKLVKNLPIGITRDIASALSSANLLVQGDYEKIMDRQTPTDAAHHLMALVTKTKNIGSICILLTILLNNSSTKPLVMDIITWEDLKRLLKKEVPKEKLMQLFSDHCDELFDDESSSLAGCVKEKKAPQLATALSGHNSPKRKYPEESVGPTEESVGPAKAIKMETDELGSTIEEGSAQSSIDTSTVTGATLIRHFYPVKPEKKQAIIVCVSRFSKNKDAFYERRDKDEKNDLRRIPGAEVDGDSLCNCLKDLNFVPERLFNEDATKEKIKETLINAANKEYDVSIVAVISHGNSDSVKDYEWNDVKVQDIISYFKGVEKNARKPKVFIFNACRGSAFEDYHTPSGDGSVHVIDDSLNVPKEAHILHFYSSVLGYSSLTSSKGSCFNEALVDTLKKKTMHDGMVGTKLDVVAAFTEVIRIQSQRGLKKVLQYKMAKTKGKKVVAEKKFVKEVIVPTPCIVSTLTQALYFH